MPADSNNNQNSNSAPNQGVQPNLSQISSSDAPPIASDVSPISDAASPRVGKEYEEPSSTIYVPAPPHPLATPEPNMPPQSISSPDPVPLTVTSTPPPLTTVENPPLGTVNSSPPTINQSGLPKKLLLIVGVIVGLLILAFLIVRFLIPLFNQSTGDGSTPINQTEITWWGLWEDQQIVAPIINTYQEQNPGIKITYVPQSKENYRERLTSAFARGEGPDIFRFHNTWMPMFSQELETVPTSIVSQEQFSQNYYPVMTRDLLTSDGLKGIPLEYDGLALFINDEIFTTFGKTPPSTWNEFEQLATEMTVKDENGLISQAGAALGNTSNVDHWPEIFGLIMLQNGVNPNNVQDLSSSEAAQALQFYTDFVQESEVWDDRQPNSTIAFAAGNVAMYFAPSWRVFEISQQNPNLQFRIVPVPQIPREDSTSPDITYATYWVEGVSQKSSKKNEAWDFLNYLSQRDTLEKFYQSASQIRMFGEPYPRQDMRDLLLTAPKIGGFMELAPTSQSWYLASRTWDGDTGINTRINQYFEDAINGMLGSGSANPEPLMQTVSTGVQDVFVQYRLATPAPAPAE